MRMTFCARTTELMIAQRLPILCRVVSMLRWCRDAAPPRYCLRRDGAILCQRKHFSGLSRRLFAEMMQEVIFGGALVAKRMTPLLRYLPTRTMLPSRIIIGQMRIGAHYAACAAIG